MATVCLHWFNPLVHLMSREIIKACEFSCDEAVLAKMGYDNAQDYGKTLLDAMATVGKYKEEQWHEQKTEGISRLCPLPIRPGSGKWAATSGFPERIYRKSTGGLTTATE